MKSMNLLFALILILKVTVAFANDFKNPNSIINTLLEQKINIVGDFDLKLFQEDAKKINWIRKTEKAPPAISRFTDGRKTAYFLKKDKTVVVLSDNISPILQLHESLGVLGYNDERYAMSTALTLLSKEKDMKLQKQLIQSFGQSLFHKDNMLAAGGSSVGGGGDEASLDLKVKFIHEIISTTDIHFFPDLFTKYLEIDFKQFADKERQFVGLQYEAMRKEISTHIGANDGLRRTEEIQEFITIYYPQSWRDGKKRNLIAKEAFRKIIYIFPPDQHLLDTWTFTPYGCDKQSVTYPWVSDIDLQNIQYERASLISNCSGSNQITFARHPKWN